MEEVGRKILQIAKALHDRNLLAAADGNISFRFDDNNILITPSGQTKALMTEQELSQITLENKILSGTPSSERLMHLEIYKTCPAAKAVVHAHPPTAIAWSLAFPELKELPFRQLPEVILAAGKIPFVPYARPGTLEMGTHLRPFLPEHRLMILSRHGAVCWGESLEEAYRGIERVEHVCQILKSSMELKSLKSFDVVEKFNQATDISEKEIEALFELRKKIGPKIL
ncbi:MAG: class II aldolase/adducin family protein [Bdellovibrionales bacterium]|nr:class II aldolase/adducin family protein [Bdellovibrionales bacterium]